MPGRKGTHCGGYKAGRHKEYSHGCPCRSYGQKEVGHGLGAASAGDTHKDASGKEDEDHGEDVLIANAMCHNSELFVKAEGAVLEAGHHQRHKKDHHDGDVVKAHLYLQYVLEHKAHAQIQNEKNAYG